MSATNISIQVSLDTCKCAQAARSPSQYARSVDLALDRLADSPLVDTVNWHCSTLLALAEGNPQKACQHQAAIVGPFSKVSRLAPLP